MTPWPWLWVPSASAYGLEHILGKITFTSREHSLQGCASSFCSCKALGSQSHHRCPTRWIRLLGPDCRQCCSLGCHLCRLPSLASLSCSSLLSYHPRFTSCSWLSPVPLVVLGSSCDLGLRLRLLGFLLDQGDHPLSQSRCVRRVLQRPNLRHEPKQSMDEARWEDLAQHMLGFLSQARQRWLLAVPVACQDQQGVGEHRRRLVLSSGCSDLAFGNHPVQHGVQGLPGAWVAPDHRVLDPHILQMLVIALVSGWPTTVFQTAKSV